MGSTATYFVRSEGENSRREAEVRRLIIENRVLAELSTIRPVSQKWTMRLSFECIASVPDCRQHRQSLRFDCDENGVDMVDQEESGTGNEAVPGEE
jgi:hypothetical protein